MSDPDEPGKSNGESTPLSEDPEPANKSASRIEDARTAKKSGKKRGPAPGCKVRKSTLRGPLSRTEIAEGIRIAQQAYQSVRPPKTRRDCLTAKAAMRQNGHDDGLGDGANCARPCRWVRCPYHLYSQVNPKTGSLQLNFPDREVWELPDTCVLDVADRGGVTLEETGDRLNITRERARQIEKKAVAKLRARRRIMLIAG